MTVEELIEMLQGIQNKKAEVKVLFFNTRLSAEYGALDVVAVENQINPLQEEIGIVIN